MDKAQRHSYMGILNGGVEKEFYAGQQNFAFVVRYESEQRIMED